MRAMHRRLLLAACALTAALCGCASVAPHYTISAERLQHALEQRLPRTYYPAAGLLELQVQTPRLTLLPERNQINVKLNLQASGALLNPQRYEGALDVNFGLRYEPSDRTLRATEVRVNTLRLDGLPPQAQRLLKRYGQTLLEQSLSEMPLHQWQPQELAAGAGWQPESITVTAHGLQVQFKK